MAYPEEFFRQRAVTDTLAVLDKGLERAAQLKDGQSPWTMQKGRVVRGYRSALDGSVQPVRITVPAEYDGAKAVPLDVAQARSLHQPVRGRDPSTRGREWRSTTCRARCRSTCSAEGRIPTTGSAKPTSSRRSSSRSVPTRSTPSE